MIIDFDPGDKVINPANKNWGIGQVQSIINEKVTVNFENVGKKVINSKFDYTSSTYYINFFLLHNLSNSLSPTKEVMELQLFFCKTFNCV